MGESAPVLDGHARDGWEIVRGLGIEPGQILRRSARTCGDATVLEVATLRPGLRKDVLRAASRDVDRARYHSGADYQVTSRPTRQPCRWQARDQHYPKVALWVYTPGETIDGTGIAVPEGQIGLRYIVEVQPAESGGIRPGGKPRWHPEGSRNRVSVAARQARTRHWRTARSLGMDRGMILWRASRRRDSALEIIALRRGPQEEVLNEVSRGLSQAGYQPLGEHSARQNCWSLPGRSFPSVAITAHPRGEKVKDTWVEVPPGATGLCFILRVRPPRIILRVRAPGGRLPRLRGREPRRIRSGADGTARAAERRSRPASGPTATMIRAVQLPLRIVGVLIVIAFMIAADPVIRRKERKRYYDIARRLNLNEGEIVSRTFTAGVLTTTQFFITSLRPGSWKDVFADVDDRALMAGYSERLDLEYVGVPARSFRYRPPGWRGVSQVTFPDLQVSVYLQGQAVGQDGPVVPAGQTGLVLSL